MKIIVHRLAAFLACLLLASNAIAVLVPNADGTAYDSSTGLMWKRCAQGQTWTGTTCSGTGTAYLWQAAMDTRLTDATADYKDWRVPNIRELQTIVDRSTAPRAIDLAIFPGTVFAFWSATDRFDDNRFADFVDFDNGTAGWLQKIGRPGTYLASGIQVRLVRDVSPVPEVLTPRRLDADYASNLDSTVVTHIPTGLMWKRCPENWTWNEVPPSCTPPIDPRLAQFTWAEAMALASNWAGYPDWRLPSAEELLSLADYVVTPGPSINHHWFPNTPGPFWSASVNAASANSSWYVDFLDQGGFVPVPGFSALGSTFLKSSNTYAVRLVRGGASNGPYALAVDLQGKGSGKVMSVPVGIDCGTECLSTVYAGKSVTLTATPATLPSPGSAFGGWTGACTGSNPVCVLTMNAPQAVSAKFVSRDAILSNLTVSAGTLVPAFTKGHLPYTDAVASDVDSLTVTPTTENAGATVTVNGVSVTSGTASGAISLNVGATPIAIVVTAEDGTTTRTYTITVTRPSNNADLANLTLSAGTLAPPFASGVPSYSADVVIAGNTITVTPTVADATATVKVNGAGVISATPSPPIALVVGANPILVVVTAQDGTTTKSYDVTVNYSVLIPPPALVGIGSRKPHGGAGTFNLPLAP